MTEKESKDYTIAELISIFSKHAKEYESISNHKDSFNLPKALLVMADEIRSLNIRLEELSRNVPF